MCLNAKYYENVHCGSDFLDCVHGFLASHLTLPHSAKSHQMSVSCYFISSSVQLIPLVSLLTDRPDGLSIWLWLNLCISLSAPLSFSPFQDVKDLNDVADGPVQFYLSHYSSLERIGGGSVPHERTSSSPGSV